MPYKPIGADENGKLPPKVRAQIASGVAETLIATPDWFSIDNTGALSASAALQAIVNQAPDNATIRLRGHYLCTSLVDIPPAKNLHIDARGARFTLSGSGTKFRFKGSYGPVQSVVGIATEQVTVQNKTRTLTKLTLSAPAPAWKQGTPVKLFANDVIPGSHGIDADTRQRAGERNIVHSVSGSTVYLKQPLIENTYTTGARLAELLPGSGTWEGGTVDTTEASLAALHTAAFVRFESVRSPQIGGVEFERIAHMGITMKDVYGYTILPNVGHYAIDNSDTGNLGYFILDSSSQDGLILGGEYANGRHAFTDGTADIAADNADPANYGPTLNTKLIGVTARGMTAASFDTHHASLGVEFIDCTSHSTPEESAFSLRGRKHRVVNPKVYGGAKVVEAITQETGTWSVGESWGHELINAWSDGTKEVATALVRTASTHPQYNQRTTLPSLIIRGGNFRGIQRAARVRNGHILFRGEPQFTAGTTADAAFFQSENGVLDGRVVLDALAVTTVGATTPRVLYVKDDTAGYASDVRMEIRVSGSATLMSAAPTPVEQVGTTERIDLDLLMDSQWNNSTPVSIVDSSAVQNNVTWKYRNIHGASNSTQNSSASISITNATIAGSHRNLARSHDPVLTLRVDITDGTPRTLSQLWLGKFIGQELIITRVGTGAAITVLNGTAGRTRFNSGTDKTLTNLGDTLELFWTGTVWSQKNLV